MSVFEALHTAGGVLVYGIPEFRLPKAIVQQEIDGLQADGSRGRDQYGHRPACSSVDELFEQGFEAVFIGTGAGSAPVS